MASSSATASVTVVPATVTADLKCHECPQSKACPGFRPNRFRRNRCIECSHEASQHQQLSDEDQANAALARDDTLPSVILPSALLMGGFQAAMKDDELKKHNVTHVINCAKDLHKFLPKFKPNRTDYKYLQLNWEDTLDQKITADLAAALDFIDAARANQSAAYVHCAQGVSRSGSVVVAYIMRSQKLSYEKALAFVRRQRIIVHPNSAFAEQLKAWGKDTLNLT